ncbi:MAG TPA: hypothetical protein VKC66_20280 [Xanthobacteraceae bacterium]|nr:hypothetical protein [Xanthobacteraceae bacterium]
MTNTKKTRELTGNCSEMYLWRLLNDEKCRELKVSAAAYGGTMGTVGARHTAE